MIWLVAALVIALPCVATASEVVATIDGVDVTKGDIDLRMRTDETLRFQPIDSPQARLEALRQLSVEIAVEHVIRGALIPGSDLMMSVEQDRRRKLLGIFEASSTAGISLTNEESERFIAANPQFFSKRKTWHYHEVVVTAEERDVISIMRAKAASIGSLPSLDTAAMSNAFDWVRNRKFATIMLNRWMGSEQIDPDLMKLLEQMVSTQRRVHAECRDNTCSFVVLHEVVDDPVDLRFGRQVVEETLLAQKRARAASALHGGILKRAVIEFRDPAIARAASGTWGLPPYLKAGGFNKAIWILQISLVLLSIVWGGWYLSQPREVAAVEGTIRPKGLGKLDERLESWRFLRLTQRGLVAIIIVLICGEGVWALARTSFLEFDHDFAAVAGGSFLVLAVIYAIWRYSPSARRLASQFRFSGLGLLAACGVNALLTWAAG
ncbi:hypothetical protein [Novosphingobium sp.]|uniref:hypothetical protein n=1 Tax=Novosphingobium sp. TaxID=1874826 RepID=UPI00260F7348|nr:hypothetical protein [Novosphingobium sp.]